MEETLPTPAPLLKIWEDWGQLGYLLVGKGMVLYPQLLPNHLWHRCVNASMVDLVNAVIVLNAYLCWAWVKLYFPECQKAGFIRMISSKGFPDHPLLFVWFFTHTKVQICFYWKMITAYILKLSCSVGRLDFILAGFNHSSSNGLLIYAESDSATLDLPWIPAEN